MDNEPLMTKKFQEVWQILKKESVRGSVIIASAIIEDLLEELLKKRLLLCDEDNDLLFSGANAPIGNMASKIELSYRIGCISPKLRKSLHILRKLRNDFAHLSHEIDFDTPSVKDRTRNLLELNSDFVKLIWKGLRPEMLSHFGIEESQECQDFFTDMLVNAGFRNTFEIWASAVAGGLAEKNVEIIRLKIMSDI